LKKYSGYDACLVNRIRLAVRVFIVRAHQA